MSRGLGYVPDEEDQRDWLVGSHHVISRASMVEQVDLRPFADPVDDQRGSSACVGFALGAAFDIRGRLQGMNLPRISRVAIYTMARATQVPLRDEGCRPRDAMLGIRTWGLVEESLVPFFEQTINEPLPWGVFSQGIDATNAEFWRIANIGQYRCDVMRQALSAGFPVAFATPVDAAVENYKRGETIGRVEGDDRGGHYMLAMGYRHTDGAFLVRNSWSADWGDDGYCWMSPERIASPWISDAWVIEATPKGVS
jgi:hypothetical protein